MQAETAGAPLPPNAPRDSRGYVRCTLCDASQHECRLLIAAANDIFICDACVELMADIVRLNLEKRCSAIH